MGEMSIPQRKNIGFTEATHGRLAKTVKKMRASGERTSISIEGLADAILNDGLDRIESGETKMETGVRILPATEATA